MTREEAINKVWQMSLPKETMEILEALAPELAESEDERIRKLLVWQVYRNIEDETNDLAQSVYDGIKGHDPDLEESIEDWKKCLAWLEKQKEQKLFMANSPQLKEQKPGEIPPYVTGIKGEPDPAGVWKPSEEQMKALNEIVNILAESPFLHQNDYLFNILNGLREELKKLL